MVRDPSEYFSAWIVLGAFAATGAAYLARVLKKGRARFERVERQGESFFLRKPAMETVYWSMEPVAQGIVSLGLSANSVSWLAAFFGLLTGAAFAIGRFGLGSLFATIASVLDLLDGMVARAKSPSRGSGKVLDSTLDRYVEFFLLGGLALHFRAQGILLAFALLALMGCFMVSYSSALSESLRIPVARGNMRRPERLVLLILGAIVSTLSASPMGMTLALILIALGGNGSALGRLREIGRGLDGLDQLDQKPQRARSMFQSARGPASAWLLGSSFEPGPGTRGPEIHENQRRSPQAPLKP